MPWVRLDDGYPEHPKVDRVGPLAAWLNVCAWAYCARNLTDGFVPVERVARLASVPNPSKLAAALVDANLWEAADGGYMVHDYLTYNPSREQVQSERAKTAERVQRHRNGVGNGVTPPDTNGGRTPVGNGVSTAAPYPSRTHPVPQRASNEARIPPVPTGHPPTGGRRRVTEVDESFRDELQDQYEDAFGSRQAVRDVIDHAMGHKARLKCSDQRAYLRNWVRSEAEKASLRRRRAPLSVVDARESDSVSGCPVCHTMNWDVSMGPMCPRCERKAKSA